MDAVERIAEVVLYEGFLLYPYTRSTTKNQQPWTFGGVSPRAYRESSGGAGRLKVAPDLGLTHGGAITA